MKNAQISNFMKICPMEAKMLKPDGHRQTDMMKLTVVFCNFANVPRNKCMMLLWLRVEQYSRFTY